MATGGIEMTVTADTHVGALATEHPATIRVFQQYGIDYCCGGRLPIRDACREHGAPLDTVLSDLGSALDGSRNAAPNWRTAPLAELVRHILTEYHAPQRAEFTRLSAMLEKATRVHADRWPGLLTRIATTLDALRTEADAHTADEERRVFPAIVALEQFREPSGSLARALDVLERDHQTMGALLADLEERTGHYRAPQGACNTVLGLYHGLAGLADGLREHVALENHVLFPRAAALARGSRMSSDVA